MATQNTLVLKKIPLISNLKVDANTFKLGFQTCSECAEEFCSGTCKEFQYDAYQRLVLPEKEVEIAGNEVQSSKKKGKKKRKKRKKSSGTKKVSQMPVTEEDEED